MVETFKMNNPNWVSTKVIMTDKDFTERAVFRQEFPDSSLLICLFHTLRSFKREITCEKLGLRPGERDRAQELMTLLAYSKSEAEYDSHYQDLFDSGLKSVITYYNNNWHPIRHEWVECFKGVNFTLGENTNNRLESINAKVKSVCSKYVSLSTFFDQFFSLLSCLRNERDHATIMAAVKKRVTIFDDSPEQQYAMFVTPYALNFVCKQLELRKRVKFSEDVDVYSSEGILSVTSDSCQCKFWNTMHLPCRHILATREVNEIPLFSSAIIADRWKTSHMREMFLQKRSSVVESTSLVSEITNFVFPVLPANLFMFRILQELKTA